MIRGLFITGTDTGIGKTVVSAALFHRYNRRHVSQRSGIENMGAALRYWKPIQTGFPEDDDTATVRELGQLLGPEAFAEGLRFREPVSPHLAAKLAEDPINLPRIRRCLMNELQGELPVGPEVRWIVEGAGGVLVPLNAANTMADVILTLELPVLVVARTTLGTINHTLLTVEALRQRGIPVAGVLMVGDAHEENREAIERHGKVPVIGQMPRFDPLTAEALGEWSRDNLDPRGYLQECFE